MEHSSAVAHTLNSAPGTRPAKSLGTLRTYTGNDRYYSSAHGDTERTDPMPLRENQLTATAYTVVGLGEATSNETSRATAAHQRGSCGGE